MFVRVSFIDALLSCAASIMLPQRYNLRHTERRIACKPIVRHSHGNAKPSTIKHMDLFDRTGKPISRKGDADEVRYLQARRHECR